MLGYGYGVSEYPKFYDQELDSYQVLPHPYKGYLECFHGNKPVKEKWVLDLADQDYFVSGKVLKKE